MNHCSGVDRARNHSWSGSKTFERQDRLRSHFLQITLTGVCSATFLLLSRQMETPVSAWKTAVRCRVLQTTVELVNRADALSARFEEWAALQLLSTSAIGALFRLASAELGI